MQKSIPITLALAALFLLSSCGVTQAWVLNQNQNVTQVHLGGDNFRIVGEVQGTADVSYVLLFGGVKKKQLYSAAYSDLLEKANLQGAQTLTNLRTEEHLGGAPPFYFKRTLTVSANIVEFIE